MIKSVITAVFLFPFAIFSQFAPPVGQTGTTAISKDSSVFVAWADGCHIQRGFQDISNPTGPYATVGDSTSPLGIADDVVVSLGDSGIAICRFQIPIANGPGPDFAVFENAFDDTYLELGFVEVSSDGVHFFRFPATSNTQDTVQTGTFGLTDATKIDNLGGKYRVLYGTPFDLNQLQGIAGLDISNIGYVKIVDVIGSIGLAHHSVDRNGHLVNDPYPTAFASGGFDLDAVGVIHNATNSVKYYKDDFQVILYPTLTSGNLYLSLSSLSKEAQEEKGYNVVIFGSDGKSVFSNRLNLATLQMDVSGLPQGEYFLQVQDETRRKVFKFIKE